MNRHRALLNSLLRTLVEEWGRDEVIAALAHTNGTPNEAGDRQVKNSKNRPHRDHIKPSAAEQVDQLSLQGEVNGALMEIADRYDRRQFLPSVADVREFLLMMGHSPSPIKDRKDAFRVLLRSLTQLPIERLRQLNSTSQHSGPSQLGPLSDAISSAGKQISRQTLANEDFGDRRVSQTAIAVETRQNDSGPAMSK